MHAYYSSEPFTKHSQHDTERALLEATLHWKQPARSVPYIFAKEYSCSMSTLQQGLQ